MALRTPLTVSPFMYIGDSTGRPLDYGRVYFGEPNKDPEFYPIDIYIDEDMTKPLAQPIRTKGGFMYGNGDMVEAHAKEVQYSVKVLDQYGRKVLYKGVMYRNNVSDFLVDEIERATTAEGIIATSVTTEEKRALDAEKVITDAVVTERDRAVAAEEAIDAKAVALAAKDIELAQKITSLAGGRKSYKTYAEMVAKKAEITANSIVDITNDTAANNGAYNYDGTTFTKSAYDPLTQSKSYTDSALNTKADKVKKTFFSQFELGHVSVGGDEIASNSIARSPVYKFNEGDVLNVKRVNQSYRCGYSFSATDKVGHTATDWSNSVSQEVLVVTKEKPFVRFFVRNYPDILAPLDLALAKSSVEISTESPVLYKEDINFLVNTSTTQSGEIQALETYVLPPPEIVVGTEAGGFKAGVGTDSTNPTKATALDCELMAGDVLTFEYKPFNGVFLWLMKDDENNPLSIIPLRDSSGSTLTRKLESYKASADCIVRIVNYITGTAVVNGGTGRKFTLLNWDKTLYETQDNTMLNAKRTQAFNVKKGNEVIITEVNAGAVSVLRKENSTGLFMSVLGHSRSTRGSTSAKWVADSDSTIKLSGTSNAKFLIKDVASDSLTDYIDTRLDSIDFGNTASDKPAKVLKVGAKTSVFATHKNFILKDELVNGVSTILISKDLGNTWTQVVNTIGKITNFHFFVDGSIMLCGVGSVWYLDGNYTVLKPSTILDHDGSTFIPETPNDKHHFYSLITGNQTQYVGDTELFVWGEYIFNGIPRLWYTSDRGRTIKCAIKFGTTVLGDVKRVARHVHMVTQRKKDGKFYITTGDAGNENMILTGVYDVPTDTWTWKILASGNLYKFGDIFFDDYYAYLVTDYNTAETLPLAALYRVAIENLNDFSKYHILFKPKAGEMAGGTLSRYIEDNNGNKVVFPDNAAHGRLWIAAGDMKFNLHTTSPLTSFMNRLGINDNGDVYCNDPFQDAEPTGTMAQKLYINHGSHNLTEIMRNSGLKSFMSGRTLIGTTWIS